MQTNPSYPLVQPAPGILDLAATLQATPSVELTNADPVTMLQTNLPPLDFLLLADRLAELYELVFPDHPEWLQSEVVDWKDEADVAAAVERFLGRVGTLFPVHDDIWDMELEVVEWRLWEIPVIPFGYDEWADGWDAFKEPAAYLLHMCYSRTDEDRPYLQNEFADLYPDHQTPRYLEPHRLVAPLRQMALPEPLDALPDLIEMLNHSTGNAFLDMGELSLAEGGGYPPWNQENVAWLAAEWQQAKPLLDRLHRLLDWQNSTPQAIGAKLTAVRDVLLAAYQQTQVGVPRPHEHMREPHE